MKETFLFALIIIIAILFNHRDSKCQEYHQGKIGLSMREIDMCMKRHADEWFGSMTKKDCERTMKLSKILWCEENKDRIK